MKIIVMFLGTLIVAAMATFILNYPDLANLRPIFGPAPATAIARGEALSRSVSAP